MSEAPHCPQHMERNITSDVDPTGQAWLAGAPSPGIVRVADICLRKLCRTFCEQLPTASERPLPEALDDLSRACLLLAVEWGHRSPETTSASLTACLDKVAGHFWGDLLPWQLALEFCQHNPRGVFGLDQLTANLDHHNSCIRLWMFDLAWCVRDRLNPVEASVRLLKNLADTLGYWDSALGLCRNQFLTDEAFWAMADNFKPKDFSEQYRERMVFARKQGLCVFQQRFERGELRLRRLISQSAFGLTPEEIKLAEGAK